MSRAALPTVEPAPACQYLTFLLGTRRYAMPAEPVREVIGFSSLTEVPMMPDFLRGVVNVRGSVVPLVDLSRRLGLEPAVFGKRSCVVVLDLTHGAETSVVGVLVDAVHAVLNVNQERVEPPPADLGLRRDFLGAMFQLEGRPVIVLDIARVLDVGELVELMGRAARGTAASGADAQGSIAG